MQCREFGTDKKETVILLHGGGLSWWNYREAAALLQDRFHVILPVLDGHAGSGRPYTSMENNADEIIAWMDAHCEAPVFLIGGLSLGGQVLLEMLSRRSGLCRHALIESAMAIPSALTSRLIGPSLACSYGLIRNRRFARLQFRALRMKEELFEDYYADTRRIARADMAAFLKASASYALKPSVSSCAARAHIFAGERETRGILRSAELLRQSIPGSELTILPGLRHGEFSLNHPREYAQFIRSLAEDGSGT